MADDYRSNAALAGRNVPESVRARILAGQLMAQSAAAASAPYTSKGVVGLKAIEGLMDGLAESSAMREAQQGQMAHRALVANLLMSTTPGAMAAGGSATSAAPASVPTAAPMGHGGIGSDHVASPGDPVPPMAWRAHMGGAPSSAYLSWAFPP